MDKKSKIIAVLATLLIICLFIIVFYAGRGFQDSLVFKVVAHNTQLVNQVQNTQNLFNQLKITDDLKETLNRIGYYFDLTPVKKDTVNN